jgi:serine/tyrosine/threonine adenylyltransferase
MAVFRPSKVHESLGDGFFDPVAAAGFPKAILRHRNQRWAKHVGLASLDDSDWLGHFGRFEPLPGSFSRPLALRYHGHQFRVYNPEIGDGRGFLFAQLVDDRNRLLDLATKGSGLTPYSRTADGRLTLKGGMREVLATAMLEAQGVNTSKSFSLIETGEALYRSDEPSPTRSSVLVRLSHSHIRIGTFQRLLYENDAERIEKLVRHCLTHYPDAPGDAVPVEAAQAALCFFQSVVRRIARLGAQWMAAGFVHGVLNTDNNTITGESFDYGPYRWLPVFEPGFTAAYFDQFGLYAYGRQPGTLKWNLARLAECLSMLVPVAALEAALEDYDQLFTLGMSAATLWRLGLQPVDAEADDALVSALFTFLRESQAPFELVFFACAGGLNRLARFQTSSLSEFALLASFDRLKEALAGRVVRPDFRIAHPYFAGATPESMLYDAIEDIWRAIDTEDDWSLFDGKLARIELMRQAYGG